MALYFELTIASFPPQHNIFIILSHVNTLVQ